MSMKPGIPHGSVIAGCRRGRLAGFLANRGGAQTVELAFALPILLMLMFGIMEFGRVMWVQGTLQHAAEEAGRYVMTHGSATDEEVRDYALAKASESAVSGVAVTVDRVSEATADYATITARRQVTPFLPFAKIGGIDLIGQTRVPIRQ
ncbi:MAG: TadE/TadG family type IV pilus assembly protein [Kiloniellales bacterium]